MWRKLTASVSSSRSPPELGPWKLTTTHGFSTVPELGFGSTTSLTLAPAYSEHATVLTSISTKDIYPTSIQTSSTSGSLAYSDSSTVSLSRSNPPIVLDYGTESAGFPFFEVSNVSAGGVQIELRYSEAKAYLDELHADGPWTFSNGLSNSFRVETFNVTTPGRVQSFFIQGGLRWQGIKALTDGSVSISRVGLASTGDNTPLEDLPGYFESSNETLNQIWGLGVRASQQACITNGSAPSTWEITDQGAFVRGQAPAQSALGPKFSNYTLAFSTKIYPVDFDVKENQWYRISTTINATGYSVTINGSSPVFISNANTLSDWRTNFGATGDPTLGTWGFGPFQDQEAFVRDVTVTSSNGTTLYHNAMTDEATLLEYGVGPNTRSVCLDGAKRDRLVWSGDFLHTALILGHSTNRTDFLSESLSFLLDWRGPAGSPYANLAGMSPKLGSSPEFIDAFAGTYGLLDYQFLFLAAAGEYYQHYGDAALPALRSHWGELKDLVAATLPLVNSATGLISTSASLPGGFFLGASNGTAPSAAFVFALRSISAVAVAIGDDSSATSWTATASAVADAINSLLWDPARGTYAADITSLSNSSSVSGTAFAILSGTANTTQAASAVAALAALRCGVGFKDSSATECTSTTQISPNTNGFLLHAVFAALVASPSNTTAAETALTHLLTREWPAMLEPTFASGASWEYMTPGLDGAQPAPALNAYTSLSHPWGGAPSYVLPMYVLGVRPTAPGFAQWEVVVPAVEAVRGALGVTWARGRVPVVGGSVEVEWTWEEDGKGEGNIVVKVKAPAGTRGRVSVLGKEVKGEGVVEVDGGEERVVEFALA
ncbi:Six-hairpin glycosidase-like protein [Phyllosticta citrichinensis]|uniref:Six-hairpin glycosidase-like protein n=1 Tax=Phyllosticta citrichinensis TaxID=1130410 RepID=A0ABR1XVI1_9PEZI